MNLNPVVSTKSMWRMILAWVCIIWGVGFLFEFLFVGMLGGFAVNYIGIKNVLIFVSESGLPGGILLWLGLKLKNKKL